MSQEIEVLQKFVKELSAKHVALDQMYTEGMKSNHDLRTQLLFRDEKIKEQQDEIEKLKAKLLAELQKNEPVLCEAC